MNAWADSYGEAVAIVPYLALIAYMLYAAMKTEKK